MIEKAKKTIIIVHLCFIFSLLLFLLLDPFIGAHFQKKKDLLLIQNLQGSPSLLENSTPADQSRLLNNRSRFSHLPPSLQKEIIHAETTIEIPKPPSYITYEKVGFLLFCLLSIPLCIQFLKRQTPNRAPFLLLPALLLLIPNPSPLSEKTKAEAAFFPNEPWLRTHYEDKIPHGLSDYDALHMIRRRGKNLVKRAESISEDEWRYVSIEGKKRKHKKLRIFEEEITLRGYQGKLRQIIITENGRDEPAFLVLNDFDLPIENVVRKYARRWLVEKEISEHISFFHLNSPSSSIVIKVDFDLTLTMLAHNVYRVFARKLPGFENSEVPTLMRKFLDTIVRVVIDGNSARILLKKKAHMPLLFGVDFMNETTFIPRLGLYLTFEIDATS